MSEIMESQTNFGRCRCCLNYGSLKYMWSQHLYEGEVEMYGEMLVQCFALCFEQSEDMTEDDQICDSCIIKLRDAHNFKKAVLEAQEIMQLIDKEGKPAVKLEKDIDSSETDGVVLIYNESGDEQELPGAQSSEDGQAQGTVETMEYEEVEFLEEDDPKVVVNEDSEIVSVPAEASASQSTVEDAPKKKCKWPKKLPKNERYKTYKQYTTEDLKKCLEAVSNEEMTPLEASEVFNIPKKTILVKAREFKNAQTDTTTVKTDAKGKRRRTTKFICNAKRIAEQNKLKRIKTEDVITIDVKPIKTDIDAEQVRTKYKAIVKAKFKGDCKESDKFDANEMAKHRDNIKAILECSNATMIKGYWGSGYSCYFCNEQRSEPAELKLHNLQAHNDARDDAIKVKYVSDLVIRLDITNLQCELCKNIFDELENFTAHLKAVHSRIIHTDVKNYIIPFKFDGDTLKCVACGKQFKYFKLLSEHMSEHYRNYECPICERAFINKQSMQTHSYRHKSGVFKCTHCPKIFDTRPKRSVHERIVHALSNKTRKCAFCDARFSTKDLVQSHEVKVHGVKPTIFSCQACNKSYNSQSSLITHRKRFHLMLRPHQCSYCEMAFFSRIELKSHTVTHTKSREFKCEMCGKCFGTRCSLNQHVRGHLDDRRFKCEHCERAFVHRTAWKVHMRSKHGKIV